MASLYLLLPTEQKISIGELESLVHELRKVSCEVPAKDAIDMCHELSRRILADPRTMLFPSLQALGFWLRAGHMRPMVQEGVITLPRTMRVPRGVVFQIPPRNVDNLFGYTMFLSLLCGNITITRLWKERTEEQNLLLEILHAFLPSMPEVLRDRMIFVHYEHDVSITAALSGLCDARMVWGGDATVEDIRRMPLPAQAVEVSFPDRFSAAAIDAKTYIESPEEARDSLVRSFASDIYTFNQRACSSPRLLVWRGAEKEAAQAAADFYPRLHTHALTTYGPPDVGAAVEKTDAQFLALHDLDLVRRQDWGPRLSVLTLRSWKGFGLFKTLAFGHGVLFEARVESLEAWIDHLNPKDQTLSLWGIEREEADVFVRHAAGRGFERIVPIGQALTFDAVWDGRNLFETLTKLIRVFV